MKSFPPAVWCVVALFALIMIVAAYVALNKETPPCKVDPARIQKLREHRL